VRSERAFAAAAVFDAAADLEPCDRARLLDDRCADDHELRAEVESLLIADDRAGSFLDPLGVDLLPKPGGDDTQPVLVPGDRVGRYVVRAPIAAGGMGVVYEASQDRPQRTVALKVIKPGLLSADALRRFEYEAQVLGSLSHPGIAQVYEAGTHLLRWGVDTNAPATTGRTSTVRYFAMELIPGAQTILQHADSRGLGLVDRVGLFVRVCDAVGYAHQRGVIHRDIKPANILVGASGVPKVIDFGVARVVGDISDASPGTIPGAMLGTLRSMSPEQLGADSHAVDTRSDVYSMGLVLFELLTGSFPYDLDRVPLVHIPRVVRDTPARRPSSIVPGLKGDLEIILLKAIEKDRAARYQSIAELGGDLERWLSDRPILARPPGGFYHIRKFAMRNKTIVSATSAILLTVIIAAVALAWETRTAEEQRDAAIAAEALAARQQQRAEQEAMVARRTNEFFRSMLHPQTVRGREVTVRELVDRSAAGVAADFRDQPLIEAGVRDTLGETYIGLGDYNAAERQLLAALEIRTSALGPDNLETLDTEFNLASLYWTLGRSAEAEPRLRHVEQVRRRLLGDDDENTLFAAGNLGAVLTSMGKIDEAIAILRRTVDVMRRTLGNNARRTIDQISSLEFALRSKGDAAAAEPLLREVLAYRKSNGNDDPLTITTQSTLANVLRTLGKFDEAEALCREALAARERLLPAGHESIGDSMAILGRILSDRGNVVEAAPLLEEALRIHRAALPKGSWRTAVTQEWLGDCLIKLQRYDDAERELLEASATLQRTPGMHPQFEKGATKSLIELYRLLGNASKAGAYEALLDNSEGREK
jgi:eukaryotic-like serine/threonine-protein kinase